MTAQKDGGDLRPRPLPNFDWSSVESEVAWDTLFRLVESRLIECIDWYLREKRSKAAYARLLRLLAVVAAAAGAVTPLVAQITGLISLIWGYVALGVAALAVGIDRALGYSRTWTRYMTTATDLQKTLSHFQLEWARISSTASGTGKEIDREAAWATLIKTSDALADAVALETSEWSADFSLELALLERETRKLTE